ncbi:MAG: thiol reductant ABC exporter subunit CydD [Neisseriaceae bacterium]|nr:MAG: thiol reductant ABC exporter subunit CydD [Neisseriaceae bacterium]
MEPQKGRFQVKSIASQKKVIRQYLNQILVDVKGLLNVALFFAILSLILFIVQSWFLANLFSSLVMVYLEKIDFDQKFFLYHLSIISFCLILRPLLQYIRERFSQKASFLARQKIQNQLITIISHLGPESRVFGSEGVLSSKLMDQIDALDDFISRYYVQVLLVVITPIIILSVVIFYSRVATIIFIITVPLIIIFMILVGASAADRSRAQFDALNRLSGYFLDLIRGMKTITHFNAVRDAAKIIHDTSDEYRKGTMSVLKLAFLSIGTLEFFSSISIAGIALYLGLGLMANIPGYTNIIMVPYQPALFILLLAPEFYAPLRILGRDYHAKANAEGAMAELIPILKYDAWIHPGKNKIFLSEGPMLTANDLYIEDDLGKLRLKTISFNVRNKERILIKGDSGVGKTSLFEAILAFIPYQGKLKINEQELSEISRDDWHEQISYLSQSPRIVSGTISSNLRLASPNASDEELLAVLEKVGLKDFVLQLPKQLDTLLGERGLGLSGGQLGRLSIAQLLLKDAWLWLIDEPTEHLDPDTSKMILNLLEEVTQDKTVLLISHQEEFLNWLDRTIWIE